MEGGRSDLPEGIDSHFHLDRSRAALEKPRASVEDLCMHVRPVKEFWLKLTGGFIIFCDPETYSSSEEVQHLSQADWTASKVFGFEYRGSFPALFVYARGWSIGRGRVELYSGSIHVEQEALDRVLEHIQRSHVLVLHAKGMMSGQPGGTYLQLLYQLKGVVSREQKIHLHCFKGNLDTMNQWKQLLPNTHFGFTVMVQHFNDSKEALKQLQEEKLLLEKDAPYFRIGGRRHSSPALIADMVAKIRGQTWKEVIEYALRNASCLFQMSA